MIGVATERPSRRGGRSRCGRSRPRWQPRRGRCPAAPPPRRRLQRVAV